MEGQRVSEPIRSTRWLKGQTIDERTESACIPLSLTGARLENYDVERGDKYAHDTVFKWLRNYEDHREKGIGLQLVGTHGSGKTHLAIAALRAAIRSYRQCGRYITTNNYIRALDESRNNDGVLPDNYPDGNLLHYLRSAYDVVVLDDVDSVRDTEFARRELTDLLESRVQNKLVTIVTLTNKRDPNQPTESPLIMAVNAKFASLVRGTSLAVSIVDSADQRSRPVGR